MPIQTQDIKIFASDTMNDAAEGGGAITGNVIVDGQSNNIFEDISTLDRVYGAVHMRKVFPAVSIQTQDKYFGSHVIISKLPADEKLGVNLFKTNDWFDRRPSAKSRIENYRAKGANYTGFLFATQYKDSKVITIFQGEDAPLPGVGDVLFLTQAGDTQTQFIKIVKIEDHVQAFSDAQGPYRRRIIEIEISQPLIYDFVGAQISRFDTITPGATIKQTLVANAAKYYSARRLAVAANNTDTVINVDTVYSQVIPSSLQELSITDADANGSAKALFDGSKELQSVVISNVFGPNLSFYLGSPILPGSFTFTSGGSTIVDVGGTLKSGATAVGTIDYYEGTFTFLSTSPTYSGSKTVYFKPATAPSQVADTASEAISDANRGFIYNFTIIPNPAPGSVQVSYRALGTWNTLYDDGNGKLAGLLAGVGTGTINYITGTLSITLSALPDDGSAIIYSWAKTVRYENRANQTPAPFNFTITLGQEGIAPGTLSITWIGADAASKTATADVYGVISGSATGTIDHSSGAVKLQPNSLPLGGTIFNVDYSYGDPLAKNFTAPVKTGGNLVLDLEQTNIVPNSLNLSWNVAADPLDATYVHGRHTHTLTQDALSGTVYATDNGLGSIVKPGYGTVGSINYSTGIITFNPDITATGQMPVLGRVYNGTTPRTAGGFVRDLYTYSQIGSAEKTVGTLYPTDGSGFVNTKFRASDSPTSVSTTVTLSQLKVDLTDGFDETIVPGSVRFKLGTLIFTDRSANGQLYTSINPTTGVGIFSGTIDYASGVASIASWADGPNTLALQSLTTERGKVPVNTITFRIPNSPVRVGSFQVRATKIDGTLLTATSNSQGEIVATDIIGFIDYQTGVVNIQFGNLVTAAGNEAEDWYNPLAVDDDGKIIEPELVLAETLLYNAVSQTFLPLDSSILGLDPVRLPQDGRVPVFAAGDVVVVLHDQKTTGTYTNAEVTSLGRGRIAKLTVRDSANQEILASKYVADLDVGTITWADLSGVSQPLTITNRIEDMSILTDVQITGKLTLSLPLTHDYPIDETLISNAVIYGDLFARTSIPFDQQTWTNVWSDSQIGSGVAAQYNNSQFPIAVDNASAIQERWALIFSSSSTVHVVGENVGQILTAVSIGADIAPINPNTAEPFFTIPKEGWGSGWSSGNVLRFNTIGANAPVWIIQSIAQGEATDTDYTFCLEVRGDIDTP